jgi:hypothetical protein
MFWLHSSFLVVTLPLWHQRQVLGILKGKVRCIRRRLAVPARRGAGTHRILLLVFVFVFFFFVVVLSYLAGSVRGCLNNSSPRSRDQFRSGAWTCRGDPLAHAPRRCPEALIA